MAANNMKKFAFIGGIAFILLAFSAIYTYKSLRAESIAEKKKAEAKAENDERKALSSNKNEENKKDQKDSGKDKDIKNKSKADSSSKKKGSDSGKKTEVSERTIAPPDRVSARRHLVHAVHQLLEQGDFEQASALNSFLAQEAFQRAYRVNRVWLSQMRDKKTNLIPRNKTEKFWNGKDTGADCFPFLLLTSHFLDPESEPIWLSALAKERELCGPLPKIVDLSPMKVRDLGLKMQIFDGAEYVKDGLISVADLCGQGPWFDRMTEVMDALVKNAAIETSHGLLCASDSEVNGDMLQTLPRLYWATNKPEYLDLAERTMEAYLFGIFPKNNGFPAAVWDFQKEKPVGGPFFRFRDHGNEVIPGLAEVYFVEKIKGRPQAVRYREPLKEFLDLVLASARSEDGMWYDQINTEKREVREKRVVDNWGYILNAYRTFDLAEGTDEYSSEIQRVMRAAATRRSFQWEGKNQDGYADSIESMIYQLVSYDIPECRLWMDDEIEIMFLKQQDSGLVETTYLDGNFVRTALLYGYYKTQGVLAAPWREDLRLGAAQDRKNGILYLSASSVAPWEGVVRIDYPRHRDIWNLPINYPRLNAWPEWFVAESGKRYVVEDLETGKKTTFAGDSLVKGYPLKIDGEKTIRLKISLEQADKEKAQPMAVSSK